MCFLIVKASKKYYFVFVVLEIIEKKSNEPSLWQLKEKHKRNKLAYKKDIFYKILGLERIYFF